jgi:hypothetical protein
MNGLRARRAIELDRGGLTPTSGSIHIPETM